MDSKKPRPSVVKTTGLQSKPPVKTHIAAAPLEDMSSPVMALSAPKHRRVWWIVLGSLGALVIACGALVGWYTYQLTPVDSSDNSTYRFEIKDGAYFDQIASALENQDLIRNRVAFSAYAWLSGKHSELKAGTCNLTKQLSSQQIIKKLAEGCHDFKSITFFPGATIEKPLYQPEGSTVSQTMYIKYVLQSAGYSEQEIEQALQASYTGSLFEGKPAGTTLEGYVFGETYYVPIDASAQEVLQTAFSHFESVLTASDLQNKFTKQGLSLYQAITLASIVQRELNCEDKPTKERKDRCYGYQQTIAQVFLKRLREGSTLGSDVTFIYAADMLGVAPTVDLDSPYNTRIHTGLPPGPIAAPGELALQAVANPSATNYTYFLAGDDGLIYFAETYAEHEENIRLHCQQLCQL